MAHGMATLVDDRDSRSPRERMTSRLERGGAVAVCATAGPRAGRPVRSGRRSAVTLASPCSGPSRPKAHAGWKGRGADRADLRAAAARRTRRGRAGAARVRRGVRVESRQLRLSSDLDHNHRCHETAVPIRAHCHRVGGTRKRAREPGRAVWMAPRFLSGNARGSCVAIPPTRCTSTILLRHYVNYGRRRSRSSESWTTTSSLSRTRQPGGLLWRGQDVSAAGGARGR